MPSTGSILLAGVTYRNKSNTVNEINHMCVVFVRETFQNVPSSKKFSFVYRKKKLWRKRKKTTRLTWILKLQILKKLVCFLAFFLFKGLHVTNSACQLQITHVKVNPSTFIFTETVNYKQKVNFAFWVASISNYQLAQSRNLKEKNSSWKKQLSL